jgi:hypothetical protein
VRKMIQMYPASILISSASGRATVAIPCSFPEHQGIAIYVTLQVHAGGLRRNAAARMQ